MRFLFAIRFVRELIATGVSVHQSAPLSHEPTSLTRAFLTKENAKWTSICVPSNHLQAKAKLLAADAGEAFLPISPIFIADFCKQIVWHHKRVPWLQNGQCV